MWGLPTQTGLSPALLCCVLGNPFPIHGQLGGGPQTFWLPQEDNSRGRLVLSFLFRRGAVPREFSRWPRVMPSSQLAARLVTALGAVDLTHTGV